MHIYVGFHMDKISSALTEFQEMDELSAKSSPIHNLHPLVKLVVTLTYIFFVVSFDKYNLSGLMIMVLYPIIVFQVSGVSVRTCFYKLRIVMPLVCAVGLVNPFFDRAIMLNVGSVAISGGVISMLTLMLKGVFALMASFLLIATTSMDAICAALRKLHVPGMIVTLLLLTYRYISVMLSEVSIMSEAYHLRAPNQKGIHISAWGSFLGQLLLRSMDRADELYQSMQLRGFKAEFYYADTKPCTIGAVIYMLVCIAFFIVARKYNLPQMLGSILM